ncbi:MAG: chemotaxis protein CheW [Deltaproteobacteria bacterium]|nr:chemotaxis protein CheW [Deltaproteobacteria bacterium]
MDTSKYRALYLQEAGEHLRGIEDKLIALEKNPADEAVVDALFRHYHSIKGMSASMGYETIKSLSHAQEELLDNVRRKKVASAAGFAPALLEGLDVMRALVKKVEEGTSPDADISHCLDALRDALAGGALSRPKPPEERVHELKLSSVMKVDGAVFDDLLSTTGEMVMSLSAVRLSSQRFRSIELKDGIHQLGKEINRLYERILEARMLPAETLVASLPRVIRDLSVASGKQVELSMQGIELGLDRSILEGIAPALVHIIRNCVDHGLETASEREKAGKPAVGRISIKVYAKKDKVVIEVSDDGKGINAAKVRLAARSKGYDAERLNAMTDKEACMLVCLPGLSSADKVTDVSGRGVGMDAVKSVVDALRGVLDIESSLGKGTTIRMELPRTTAIVKALLVNVADERYLMPVSVIERVALVSEKDISSGAFVYEGEAIPIIHLAVAFGIEAEYGEESRTLIIVEDNGLGASKRLVGFVATGYGEEMDAYIKPLVPPAAKLCGVSGIAVMGDGTPVFMLDPERIAERAFRQAIR